MISSEITACNRANVCTYVVMGGVELDQPGFTVEIPAHKGQKMKMIVVCAACARAMRGRHKIQRIKNSKDFVCAMGPGKYEHFENVSRELGGKTVMHIKTRLQTTQAVELSLRTQAAVQIGSNLPAPSNGGPIYRFLPVMRTRWMAGAAAPKSG